MTTQLKKQQAIKTFFQKLDEKDRKNISKVVLFGSLAWGKPERDSDIDLMVFAKKPVFLKKKISDLTYDILLERGETIEPQIVAEKEYQSPSSYFVWQVIHKGQKIYDQRRNQKRRSQR